MTESRGSVGFASTYRPPLPLDIFSCPAVTTKLSRQDEHHMSDGKSYNYNAQYIPSAALKTILKRPVFASSGYTDADVDSGRLTGMIYVSERDRGLETLHIAIRCGLNDGSSTCKVFSLADVFGTTTFNGVRMEDSGSVAGCGDYLVYVTTKDPAPARRQPWTAVYKTNLTTGATTRLTPVGQADLSPSMHPSGTKIAIASFQGKAGGWDGEIEDLKTNIFVMNVEAPFDRKMVVENGGWPSWGSDSVIFFHRKVGKNWGVFRAENIGGGLVNESRVTPDNIDAMTPAAIDDTRVAVATIRQKSAFGDERVEAQYRHIEIFRNSSIRVPPTKITQQIKQLADHFNPFVMHGGTKRIGYHRVKTELADPKTHGDIQNHSNKIASPEPDVGVFRVPGIFPTFSKDGTQMAFVDNEFKKVWLADRRGLRTVYENNVAGRLFAPVWNLNPKKDVLYINFGPSFSPNESLDILAIPDVSKAKGHSTRLTNGDNNAFPCTNPEGTKLVFRSTRDGGADRHKNLYIMNDLNKGDYAKDSVTRLTNGPWTDTHCQWSPNGAWIVFSSSRDKPKEIVGSDNNLDPGYFAVFLVKADDPTVIVRVAASKSNIGQNVAGHVNHPFFSPDGRSICVSADLAAVSAEPISLPLFVHSVRPYGDIFIIDIDPNDIKKNENVEKFKRITHSRYENSTSSWTGFSTEDRNAAWNKLLDQAFTPLCPHLHEKTGGETWYVTGHLCIPKRSC